MSIPQSLYHIHLPLFMPEAISTIPPPAPTAPTTMPIPESTSTTPPVPPATSSTSEPFMTISAPEFRAMLDQHTVIPHQIQQHLGILPPSSTNILGLSELVAPTEDATTTEALIQTTQEATRDPSSSHDPTTRGTTSSLYFNRSCHIEGNVDLDWGES
ncbi:hypothetical protein CK203_114269 [Vitis vinifera]|uniref:Uncharacterized protein n=1 Tax=Vitis vinifera TaxID=29760 RepID=A0A438CBD6_VITVI|nr:hypothetical protein CK203_114269 [Vitis vinifera]